MVQFIVDHAERSTKAGLVHQLPPAIDEALVEAGFKGKPGAPALNTLMHRISVLSMAHHLVKQPNPCVDSVVKAAQQNPQGLREAQRPAAQAARADQGAAGGGAGNL